MTVLEVIQRSTEFLAKRGVESPRLQAELLLAQVLALPRMKLYLNFERILTLAIERIPKIERTVLHLYYFEELTLREIASVVGMHLSRVGQLRVQAVLRLRSHLDKVWNSAPRSKQ